MDASQEQKFSSLIKFVLESSHSDFYRDHFRKHGVDTEKLLHEPKLSDIPLLTWDDLKEYPFLKRIYTTDHLFTKITYNEAGRPLLIGRTKEDMANENFGTPTDRMSVLFANVHEGIEKSLWIYNANLLPHIAEHNLHSTALTAEAYGIDGITAETAPLKTISVLLRKATRRNIRQINVVDIVFDITFVLEQYPNASLTLMLGTPEVGTIARACKDTPARHPPIFHPVASTIVEYDNHLTVTRLLELPTPLIRYDTRLSAKQVPHSCTCEAAESFVVLT